MEEIHRLRENQGILQEKVEEEVRCKEEAQRH